MMGCTASKLDNEDTVRRCKERRRLMKEAVFARHHLAAAHAAYCHSLRVTGSALYDFAANEPLAVSEDTPAVLLRKDSSRSVTSSYSLPVKPPPPVKVQRSSTPSQPPYSPAPSDVHPPPPPPHLHRRRPSPSPSPSPTIRSSNLPHILSASSVQSSSRKSHKKDPKLPHMLSDSRPSSTPTTAKSFSAGKFDYPTTYMAHSAYPTTPSQASSVWNWENFYFPSPPGSDSFSRSNDSNYEDHFMNPDIKYLNDQHHQKLDVGNVEEGKEYREEVHCSDWGDHYSTSSSDVDGDDEKETRSEISEIRSRSDYGSSVHNVSLGFPPTPSSSSSKFKNKNQMRTVDDDAVSSSVRWNNACAGGGDSSDMRMVVRHRDLKEIVASIKDYFDQAASAGDQVSEMLETGRAQLDRSLRQLKKTVYHSSGVLSNLSSSWTSKPPLAVKYQLDACALDEPGGLKSLCSTLERLLAWEKKLYEEVKAREGVKIEHEKKLATLQSQEYKGEDETKVDKTKASIKRLQSLIIVTSQAVNTTSSAIVGLRDSDLIMQLGQLCHGFMYMWRSMNHFHELQHQVVQQVRGLVNSSAKGHSTSELHRQATRVLESAVSTWHSSFCRLVKYQRDFCRSLHGWFKLSLLPVDTETNKVLREHSDEFSFLEEWKHALDRLPDTVASEAIKSFVNVVHVILSQQAEEIKIKKRTDSVSKELEKKASTLRSIEKKYYNSYSLVGLGLPDAGPDDGHMLDARDPLAEKRSELANCEIRVGEEMLKHSKAVEVTRAMTLNNIQTGLPGVFQAMTSFSSLFMDALESVCNHSYAIT